MRLFEPVTMLEESKQATQEIISELADLNIRTEFSAEVHTYLKEIANFRYGAVRNHSFPLFSLLDDRPELRKFSWPNKGSKLRACYSKSDLNGMFAFIEQQWEEYKELKNLLTAFIFYFPQYGIENQSLLIKLNLHNKPQWLQRLVQYHLEPETSAWLDILQTDPRSDMIWEIFQQWHTEAQIKTTANTLFEEIQKSKDGLLYIDFRILDEKSFANTISQLIGTIITMGSALANSLLISHLSRMTHSQLLISLKSMAEFFSHPQFNLLKSIYIKTLQLLPSDCLLQLIKNPQQLESLKNTDELQQWKFKLEVIAVGSAKEDFPEQTLFTLRLEFLNWLEKLCIRISQKENLAWLGNNFSKLNSLLPSLQQCALNRPAFFEDFPKECTALLDRVMDFFEKNLCPEFLQFLSQLIIKFQNLPKEWLEKNTDFHCALLFRHMGLEAKSSFSKEKITNILKLSSCLSISNLHELQQEQLCHLSFEALFTEDAKKEDEALSQHLATTICGKYPKIYEYVFDQCLDLLKKGSAKKHQACFCLKTIMPFMKVKHVQKLLDKLREIENTSLKFLLSFDICLHLVSLFTRDKTIFELALQRFFECLIKTLGIGCSPSTLEKIMKLLLIFADSPFFANSDNSIQFGIIRTLLDINLNQYIPVVVKLLKKSNVLAFIDNNQLTQLLQPHLSYLHMSNYHVLFPFFSVDLLEREFNELLKRQAFFIYTDSPENLNSLLNVAIKKMPKEKSLAMLLKAALFLKLEGENLASKLTSFALKVLSSPAHKSAENLLFAILYQFSELFNLSTITQLIIAALKHQPAKLPHIFKALTDTTLFREINSLLLNTDLTPEILQAWLANEKILRDLFVNADSRTNIIKTITPVIMDFCDNPAKFPKGETHLGPAVLIIKFLVAGIQQLAPVSRKEYLLVFFAPLLAAYGRLKKQEFPLINSVIGLLLQSVQQCHLDAEHQRKMVFAERDSKIEKRENKSAAPETKKEKSPAIPPTPSSDVKDREQTTFNLRS